MPGVRAGIFEERNENENVVQADAQNYKWSQKVEEIDVLPAPGDCVGEPGDRESHLHASKKIWSNLSSSLKNEANSQKDKHHTSISDRMEPTTITKSTK